MILLDLVHCRTSGSELPQLAEMAVCLLGETVCTPIGPHNYHAHRMALVHFINQMRPLAFPWRYYGELAKVHPAVVRCHAAVSRGGKIQVQGESSLWAEWMRASTSRHDGDPHRDQARAAQEHYD